MRDDRFEWDDRKAAVNFRKHGIAFDQAREAFDDFHAVDEPDDEPTEVRWRRTAGTSQGMLLVVFTERGHRIRIITARRATPHEQDIYRRQALP